jgi:ribosomal protein L3 glutamine methyltransferase
VPEPELEHMPAEFRCEPRGALAGGPDGLRLVARIMRGAAANLESDGLLAIEVGGGMAALERAFPRTPFTWPEFTSGGDGIALVAARDLPVDNGRSGQLARDH